MLLRALALTTVTLTLPQRADAAVPCCGIVAIDTKSRLITVKEKATGATCQYRVTDVGELGRLKLGQPVDAGVLPQAQLVHATTGKTGNSTCGWNGPRGGDTRPKECVDKKGNKVSCPSKKTSETAP
jgi:hypothetical protein